MPTPSGIAHPGAVVECTLRGCSSDKRRSPIPSLAVSAIRSEVKVEPVIPERDKALKIAEEAFAFVQSHEKCTQAGNVNICWDDFVLIEVPGISDAEKRRKSSASSGAVPYPEQGNDDEGPSSRPLIELTWIV